MGKRCSSVWPVPVETSLNQVNEKSTKRKKKVKKNSRKILNSEYPSLTEAQRESIQGRIFVSNRSAAKDQDLIDALDVTAIMSIGGGTGGDLPGINFFHIGIKDRSDTDYLPVFRQAAEFAAPIIASGANILVHCQGGMHRSPVVAAALLVRFGMLSADEAMESVKAARSIADFSTHDNYLANELKKYEVEVREDLDSVLKSDHAI